MSMMYIHKGITFIENENCFKCQTLKIFTDTENEMRLIIDHKLEFLKQIWENYELPANS